ncbi:methyltransferase domain-containing protein [Rhodoferax sp. 4810]|nr:methyltransferase domain-containing protein [Rhodoferax jenense]
MATINSENIRDAYTAHYYLEDCGGFEVYCASGGKELDPRLDCMARLANYHQRSHQLRILDLGCGRGEMAHFFAARGDRVDAVDYSAAALELAAACFKDEPQLLKRVRFHCASVTNPKVYRGRYDIVLASDLIEHLAVSEVEQLYKLIRRHLKHDGIFIAHTFPNLWYYRYGYPRRRRHAALNGCDLPIQPRSAYEQQMHINEQSPRVLKRQLQQAFPHVLLWAGDHQTPAGSLARSFGKSGWRDAPSLFAIAARQPIDATKVIAVLNGLPDSQIITPPMPAMTFISAYLRRLLATLRQLPVLSSLVAYLHALWRLPQIHHGLIASHTAHTTRLTALEAELTQLRQQVKTVTEQLAAVSLTHDNNTTADQRWASWYQSFENHFRGSSEVIQQRLAVYLPYLMASPINEQTPLLDIGCGRGDWLALLKNHGYAARGIDSNADAIALAQQRGLIVTQAEMMVVLNQQPAQSLGAMTALHVVEHLPFVQVLQLLDEMRRVLIPGGLVIIETPNPENLTVGACHFYTDPTHQRPIVPAVLEFALKQAGFIDVQILHLNPDLPEHHLPGDDLLTQQFNRYLHGARDYAVVARV